MRPAFRSAIGGYNKSDVNEYILRKNEEYENSINEVKAESAEALKALEAEYGDLKERLHNAEAENDSMQKRVTQAESSSRKAEQMTRRALNNAELLSTLSGAMDKDLSSVCELIEEGEALSESIALLEEKAKKLDRFSALFSELIKNEQTPDENGDISCDVSSFKEKLIRSSEALSRLKRIADDMARSAEAVVSSLNEADTQKESSDSEE